MNKICQIIAATLFALSLSVAAQAADKESQTENKPGSTPAVQTAPAAKPPALADMPFMKEEAKRLATLMERLQKETDPAERRKIMAETSCAQ